MTTQRSFGRQWWLAAAALVGAAIGAIIIWWPAPTTWVSPEGTKVTLQKVTFGKNHEHVLGGPLGQVQRQLGQFPFLKQLGLKSPRVLAQTRTHDGVTLWFHLQTAPNETAPTCEVWLGEESTGLATRAKAIATFPLEKGQVFLAVTFENYPRRAPELLAYFRLWRQTPQTTGGIAHLFRTRNPTRLPATNLPPLTPSPPDETTFSLRRVITGLTASPARSAAWQNFRPDSAAEFVVHENGQPVTNWIPYRLEASSTTANKFQTTGTPQPGGPGEIALLFQEAMWPTDSPWHIRTEFTRIGGFAPEELWHYEIADIRAGLEQSAQSVPNPERSIATNVMHGSRLTILSLRGGSQPGQGLALSVRLDGAAPEFNFSLVSIRTASGQMLPPSQTAFSQSPGMMLKVFSLDPMISEGSLELGFAVHKNRFADFIVTPILANDGTPPAAH